MTNTEKFNRVVTTATTKNGHAVEVRRTRNTHSLVAVCTSCGDDSRYWNDDAAGAEAAIREMADSRKCNPAARRAECDAEYSAAELRANVQ